jgi:hypothetical protein
MLRYAVEEQEVNKAEEKKDSMSGLSLARESFIYKGEANGRMKEIQLIDLQAVSAITGLHYNTLYKWVKRQALKSKKILNTYMIDIRDLDAFMRRYPVLSKPGRPKREAHVRGMTCSTGS